MKNWMEKNLGRRLISLALALCMVLSVLPPMAYADGDPVDATADISADDPVDPPVNGAAKEVPSKRQAAPNGAACKIYVEKGLVQWKNQPFGGIMDL